MTTNKAEYGLRNYLKKNRIFPLNYHGQTEVLNSFFALHGGDENYTWQYKIKFIQDRFASFARYAQEWK